MRGFVINRVHRNPNVGVTTGRSNTVGGSLKFQESAPFHSSSSSNCATYPMTQNRSAVTGGSIVGQPAVRDQAGQRKRSERRSDEGVMNPRRELSWSKSGVKGLDVQLLRRLQQRRRVEGGTREVFGPKAEDFPGI